ncbi:MAG: lysozyme [Pseudomonadota bacterium]
MAGAAGLALSVSDIDLKLTGGGGLAALGHKAEQSLVGHLDALKAQLNRAQQADLASDDASAFGEGPLIIISGQRVAPEPMIDLGGPPKTGFVPAPRRKADNLPIVAAHASNQWLQTGEPTVAMIKEAEPFRSSAVHKRANIWLVGYGHSGSARAGMTVNQREADRLLRADLRQVEAAVKQAVTVPLSANEFDALVSLAHNVGVRNFLNSSVLARLNEGDRRGAADAFLKWNLTVKASKPVESRTLTERRRLERRLFLQTTAS